MAILGSVDYIWRFQNTIYPLFLGAAAGLEWLRLGKHLHDHPNAIQHKCHEYKEIIQGAFQRKEGEASQDFRVRLTKNISIAVVSALAILSLLVSSVALPFLFFPLFLAIPAAVLGACAVGELVINGPTHLKNARKKITDAKQWVKEAFIPKKDEPKAEAIVRIAKNIAITTTALTSIGLICFAAAYLITYALHMITSGVVGAWNLYEILPGATTSAGAFGWYGVVGGAHALYAARKYQKGQTAKGFFHTACAALSVAFPLSYYMSGASEAVRLHHSFLGLILNLVPLRTVQMYGSVVTADAGMNVFFRQMSPGGQFDFQNIIVKNLSGFLMGISCISAIEIMRKRFLPVSQIKSN